MSNDYTPIDDERMKKMLSNQGISIKTLEDGSTQITDKEGRTHTLGIDGSIQSVDPNTKKVINLYSDGKVNVNVDQIKSVGFEDVSQIRSYRIMRQDSLVVHEVELNDGAKIKFSFTESQAINHVSSNGGGKFLVTTDNKLVFCLRNDE